VAHAAQLDDRRFAHSLAIDTSVDLTSATASEPTCRPNSSTERVVMTEVPTPQGCLDVHLGDDVAADDLAHLALELVARVPHAHKFTPAARSARGTGSRHAAGVVRRAPMGPGVRRARLT
jgi:hypothetical protein